MIFIEITDDRTGDTATFALWADITRKIDNGEAIQSLIVVSLALSVIELFMWMIYYWKVYQLREQLNYYAAAFILRVVVMGLLIAVIIMTSILPDLTYYYRAAGSTYSLPYKLLFRPYIAVFIISGLIGITLLHFFISTSTAMIRITKGEASIIETTPLQTKRNFIDSVFTESPADEKYWC